MFQMKEEDTVPEEELSEVEIGNLSKKDCEVVTLEIIKAHGRKIDAQSEKLDIFNKVRNYKEPTNQMKDTITKNTLERINSRLNDTEEWISELEDRAEEITNDEQKNV